MIYPWAHSGSDHIPNILDKMLAMNAGPSVELFKCILKVIFSI